MGSVEVGVTGTTVFTEVKDQRVKPFTLNDSAGNPMPGTIPFNSRPVLGAGGFQISARQVHHTASDRFSFVPGADFGMAWGPQYSTMFWTFTTGAAVNFANGNSRVIVKGGYSVFKVDSISAPSEIRNGPNLALETTIRVASSFDLSTQIGVALTSDGPQTILGIGIQWLTDEDKRPIPPTAQDGSQSRQAVDFAEQIMDQLESTSRLPDLLAAAGAGPAAPLIDRLSILSSMTLCIADTINYPAITEIIAKLDKVKTALDHASNTGAHIANTIEPLRTRAIQFKEDLMAGILKQLAEIFDDVRVKHCNKSATDIERKEIESAQIAINSCAEKLTILRTLFTKLTPRLTPARQAESATAQRKLACLLKGQVCASDMDPQLTVPAIQKRIKAALDIPSEGSMPATSTVGNDERVNSDKSENKK